MEQHTTSLIPISFSDEYLLWKDVKRHIEFQFINFDYCGRDGTERLPSLAELAEKYGIGKTTAQKIYDDMAKDGTIVKRASSGCFFDTNKRKELQQKHTEAVLNQIYNAAAYGLILGLNPDLLRAALEKALSTSSEE